MNLLRTPSPSNGIPFNWNDLKFTLGVSPYNNAGLIQVIEYIIKGIAQNDNMILSGCEDTGSFVYSAGLVMLDGEILYFAGGTGAATTYYFHKDSVTYNSDGNKSTQSGGSVQIYEQNRAIINTTPSNLSLIDANRMAAKIKDLLPDATSSITGLVELLTNAEGLTGTDTERAMTSSVNAYVNRTRTKITSGSESYTVQDGIGIIIIPDGVDNVTITLPDSSTYPGAQIKILSFGTKTGCSLTTGFPPATSIPSNNIVLCIADGVNSWMYSQISAGTLTES